MSNQDDNKNNKNDESRSPGSSPFASPRTDKNDIPISPRFEEFIKGMRIPNTEQLSSLATAGLILHNFFYLKSCQNFYF
jgi:hypothetical protein